MVEVLTGAGYAPEFLARPACCGLTWISTGQLDGARRQLRSALDQLHPLVAAGVPVVGLEPSCLAVWRSDAGELLPDVGIASPLDPARRGGHVTLTHPLMREATALLWQRDVVPDYRDPHGLRLGLSPLSTSFDEVERGLLAVREVLDGLAR